MKKNLSIEHLIYGGELHDELQPLRIADVKFTTTYYILWTNIGVMLLPKTEVQKNIGMSLNQLLEKKGIRIEIDLYSRTCKPFRSKSTGRKKSDESDFDLYYAEEVSPMELKFYVHQGKRVARLTWHFDNTFSVDWKNDGIYRINSNWEGDLVIASCSSIKTVTKEGAVELKECNVKGEYPWELSAVPSRGEWGVKNGSFLSPDAKKVAFYLVDSSKVRTYCNRSFTFRNNVSEDFVTKKKKLNFPFAGTSLSFKYPMAGEPSEKIRVGIADFETNNVAFIDVFKESEMDIPQMCHEESYFTNICWTPDSKSLLLCELERSQHYFQAKMYDAATGRLQKLLFDERSERYVEPETPFVFIDENRFLFLSQRSGHNHLSLYDIKKETIEPLTKGDWDVVDTPQWNEKNRTAYVTTTCISPINRTILKVPLKDDVEVFKDEEGVQRFFFNNDGAEYVLCNETKNTAGVAYFGNYAYPIENPFAEFDFPTQIIGKFHANGDDLYYRVTYRPECIEKGKKSPVLFYVYGGPHVQMITNRFGTETKGMEEYFANEGYIVYCVDPHGSANRGAAFESVIYQRMNETQVKDYDAALDFFFREYGDVADKDRMAIYGWSFGGYMTLSMLLKSKYEFRVGVAGGAVVDWRYYEVMYTERYMGVRNLENESYYEACDIKHDLHRLHTPLCLIHCNHDNVVLDIHPASLLDCANKKCKNSSLIEYYLFFGHGHNVTGTERLELMHKVESQIEKYIKH